jgi:CHAT domain-containing protein
MRLLFFIALTFITNYASAQINVQRQTEDLSKESIDERLIIQVKELRETANKLAQEGKFSDALPLRIQVLNMLEQRFGLDNHDTAIALNNVAVTYSELGLPQKALPIELQVLSIFEKLFGRVHIDTASTLSNLGTTYSELGQYENALSIQLQALEVHEKVLGPESTETATVLNNIAITYSELGQDEKSLELKIRVLEIREKANGINHIDTAQALNNLSVSYAQLGQYEKSIFHNIRALEIYEKLLRMNDPRIASVLHNLASAHSALGKYEKAQEFQIRAVTIYENSLGSENMSMVTALNNLAVIQYHLEQYEKSISIQIRILELLKKMHGEEHPATALAMNNLALIYSDLSYYEKALSTQARAVEIYEKVFGPTHPSTATAMSNLALIYYKLENYEEVFSLQTRVLKILEKAQGHEHPDVATALLNLAGTYSKLAQHDKAIQLMTRALGIQETIFGKSHPKTVNVLLNLASNYSALAQFDMSLKIEIKVIEIIEKHTEIKKMDVARALNNISGTYFELGQYQKAIPFQIRALEITEKMLGSDHPETAIALSNLALSYSELSQHRKSQELLSQALEIITRKFGDEHSLRALMLHNLASVHSELGQLDKSLYLHIQSLKIYEKTRGVQHPDTANSLNNLAQTYVSLSQYEKALPLQIQALAIYERVLGAEHPSTSLAKAALSITILHSDNSDSGIVLLKSAINSLQVQRQLVSRIGTPELKSYSESISFWFQKLADALIERGRLSEAQQVLNMLKEGEQFDFIRRASDADPRNSRIGYTREEQIWLKRYREISDRLGKLGAESRELEKQAKLGLTPWQKQRQQAITSDLKVAQAAFQEYLGQMREGLAKRGQARKVEVEEVSAQAMRDSKLLLEGLGDDVALLQYYITDKRVGILLTTSGIQIARGSEIDSKELNRLISDLRRLLQDPKSNPMMASQRLYNILMAPIAKDIDDAKIKTVMLSLDGALRYLPFGALHDGERYLVNRWNLPMYTSLTRAKLRESASPQWQAAGFGVTKAWPEFAALAGVRSEIASIVKTTSGGLIPGEIYLDEAFTATQLKEVSQRKFPLMHVASHFRFSPGTEVNSFLLLGDGQRLTIGDIRTQNYRFDNVDLLTLSACDTGLGGGRDEQGKEIEGFGVIAQQQGAKSVLATLWQVSDQSTAMLMADLYRRRQSDKLTKVEALRQSQISLATSSKYSHPFYWAPFVLMGNWK